MRGGGSAAAAAAAEASATIRRIVGGSRRGDDDVLALLVQARGVGALDIAAHLDGSPWLLRRLLGRASPDTAVRLMLSAGATREGLAWATAAADSFSAAVAARRTFWHALLVGVRRSGAADEAAVLALLKRMARPPFRCAADDNTVLLAADALAAGPGGAQAGLRFVERAHERFGLRPHPQHYARLLCCGRAMLPDATDTLRVLGSLLPEPAGAGVGGDVGCDATSVVERFVFGGGGGGGREHLPGPAFTLREACVSAATLPGARTLLAAVWRFGCSPACTAPPADRGRLLRRVVRVAEDVEAAAALRGGGGGVSPAADVAWAKGRRPPLLATALADPEGVAAAAAVGGVWRRDTWAEVDVEELALLRVAASWPATREGVEEEDCGEAVRASYALFPAGDEGAAAALDAGMNGGCEVYLRGVAASVAQQPLATYVTAAASSALLA